MALTTAHKELSGSLTQPEQDAINKMPLAGKNTNSRPRGREGEKHQDFR